MFYVSTVGSTASIWFAQALGRHPQIACLHGSKSLMPGHLGYSTEMPAQDFVAGLMNLYFLSRGEKVFGAVHGYRGVEMKPAIDAIEGGYAVMVRHPITRINSLFHREIENITTPQLPKEDVYRDFQHDLWPHTEFNVKDAGLFLEEFSRQFLALAVRTVADDMWTMFNVEPRYIFKYERLICDRTYFRNCFEAIAEKCRHVMTINVRRPGAPELACPDSYLDDVFSLGVENRKNKGSADIEEIYRRWPPFFKMLFAMALKTNGGAKAVAVYRRMGYPLPEDYAAMSYIHWQEPMWDAVRATRPAAMEAISGDAEAQLPALQ